MPDLADVDILFATNKLRLLCNDHEAAQRKWGVGCAKLLRVRLDDLKDVETLDGMKALSGKLEELKGDLKGKFSLRLDGGMRLVFEPAEDPPPKKPDGGIDLKKVTSVCISSVEDYHRG